MGLFSKLQTENSKLRKLKYSDFGTKLLVETPLPGVSEEPNALLLPGGSGPVIDFFRGGTGQGKARVDDVERIAKFFTTTEGILFTVKQNVLSNLGVRIQQGSVFSAPGFQSPDNPAGLFSSYVFNDGVYLPTSTIAQTAVSNLGIFLNKQGVDPTSNGNWGNPLGRTTYFSTANKQLISNVETNRLVLLTDKILGVGRTYPKGSTVSNDPYVLLTYNGGPNKAGGIGKTNISYVNGQKTSVWNPKFGDYITISEELPQVTEFKSQEYFFKNPGYLKFENSNTKNILFNGLSGRNSILYRYGLSEDLEGWEDLYIDLYESLDNFNSETNNIVYPVGYVSPNSIYNPPSSSYSYVLQETGSINYSSIITGSNSILFKYLSDSNYKDTGKGFIKYYEEFNNLNTTDSSIIYPIGYSSPKSTKNPTTTSNNRILSTFTNYEYATSGISSQYTASLTPYGISNYTDNSLITNITPQGKEQLVPFTNNDVYKFNTTSSILSITDNTDRIYNNNTLVYNVAQMQNASDAFYGTQTSIGGGGAIFGTTPPYNVKIVDFRRDLLPSLPKADKYGRYSSVTGISPDYSTRNVEKRVNLGDPGKTEYNRYNYSIGIDHKNYNGGTINALDTINAYPLYKAENVDGRTTSPGGGLNDLVKFRIAAIDNDDPAQKVFMHFRAFLNSFTDNYNPQWTAQKFIGRGDSLYSYGGFTRTVNLSWTLHAQSIQELLPMYRKLNYLASNTMPDYSQNGYMRAPLVELTVGGYLFDQPGFISSLTLDTDMDAGWEIGINVKGSDNSLVTTTTPSPTKTPPSSRSTPVPQKPPSKNQQPVTTGKDFDNVEVYELPKLLKVTMGFTPIPEFLPGKVQGDLIDKGSFFKTARVRNQPSSPNEAPNNYTPGVNTGWNSPKGANYLVNQYKNYIALTDNGTTFDNY